MILSHNVRNNEGLPTRVWMIKEYTHNIRWAYLLSPIVITKMNYALRFYFS